MHCYFCQKKFGKDEKRFMVVDMDIIACKKCRDIAVEKLLETLDKECGGKYD